MHNHSDELYEKPADDQIHQSTHTSHPLNKSIRGPGQIQNFLINEYSELGIFWAENIWAITMLSSENYELQFWTSDIPRSSYEYKNNHVGQQVSPLVNFNIFNVLMIKSVNFVKALLSGCLKS